MASGPAHLLCLSQTLLINHRTASPGPRCREPLRPPPVLQVTSPKEALHTPEMTPACPWPGQWGVTKDLRTGVWRAPMGAFRTIWGSSCLRATGVESRSPGGLVGRGVRTASWRGWAWTAQQRQQDCVFEKTACEQERDLSPHTRRADATLLIPVSGRQPQGAPHLHLLREERVMEPLEATQL